MLCHQAMDIAGLSKLTGETITLIVGVLGFLVGPSYKAGIWVLIGYSPRNLGSL
jgi:hypothetical protein